jgi:hypothetical protein
MSISPQYVLDAAEGLGLKPTDDATKFVAVDVANRLREIVQASHSRPER